jgi:hypothetical protein
LFALYLKLQKEIVVTENSIDNSLSIKFINQYKNFLTDLDPKVLVSILPNEFILNLSFHNFQNAITACFYADEHLVIQKTNDKFKSFFPSGTELKNQKISQVFSKLSVAKASVKTYTDQLKSQKWANLSKINVRIEGEKRFYDLFSTFTSPTPEFPFKGFQGQFIEKTESSRKKQQAKQYAVEKHVDLETKLLLISEKCESMRNDLKQLKSTENSEIDSIIGKLENTVKEIETDTIESSAILRKRPEKPAN